MGTRMLDLWKYWRVYDGLLTDRQRRLSVLCFVALHLMDWMAVTAGVLALLVPWRADYVVRKVHRALSTPLPYGTDGHY